MATSTARSARRVTRAANPRRRSHRTVKRAPRRGYDAFKTVDGRRYTGMAIGRGHTWRYDQGEWKEKKVSPDRWEISYAVTKRRKGHAPEGSGAPVGTEYHWYILAHQEVRKLNANDYATTMTGSKFKLAHKRADKQAWNLNDVRQRRQVIRLLEEEIRRLKADVPTAAPTNSSVGRHRTAAASSTNGA